MRTITCVLQDKLLPHHLAPGPASGAHTWEEQCRTSKQVYTSIINLYIKSKACRKPFKMYKKKKFKWCRYLNNYIVITQSHKISLSTHTYHNIHHPRIITDSVDFLDPSICCIKHFTFDYCIKNIYCTSKKIKSINFQLHYR